MAYGTDNENTLQANKHYVQHVTFLKNSLTRSQLDKSGGNKSVNQHLAENSIIIVYNKLVAQESTVKQRRDCWTITHKRLDCLFCLLEHTFER